MGDFKFVMFFVWAAAMILSCWAWEVGRMFARRMQKEALRRQQPGEPDSHLQRWPQAAVILPIKGLDDDTRANILALLAQEYPRYRLLFAVESAGDPVVSLLEQLSREHSTPERSIEIVIAGIATERGQKVHNQLAAVERTTERDEVLIFLDADAHPAPGWLRALVRPMLEDPSIGASTGFRYYIPVPGDLPVHDAPPGAASAILSVINAGVAALLGPGWRNIAWGGSMAIRRADFFAFGVHDAWQHALSDDYVLSWCVKNRARRKIQFVQGCLVASSADVTWPAFWEFAARQYRITKVCAFSVWLTAIGAAVLYLVGMLYTLSFFLLSVLHIVPADSLPGRVDFPLLIMFLALYIANFMRGRFLLQGGLVAFPDQRHRLLAARFWFTWAYPATLLVNLLALLKSAPSRSIEWRGVRYTMHSRLETSVHRPAKPGA